VGGRAGWGNLTGPFLFLAPPSPGLNQSRPSHPQEPLLGWDEIAPVLTLRQAAEQARTSRSSLHRDVQRGVISVTRDESGKILICPSEVARVYGSGRPSQPSHPKTAAQGQNGTAHLKARDAETAALQAQVEALRELVSRLDRDKEDLKRGMEDLRQERDRWASQAEAAQRLLLAPPKPEPKRGWWPWSKPL